MEPKEKVTIAIPTFNRSALLVMAVRSALAQTYENIEVLVSDNASTDDTFLRLAEISDRRLTVIKQPCNLGMVANWNTCLEKASGQFIILVSDDDYLESRAIEKMLAELHATDAGQADQIGLVCCRARVINGVGTVVRMGRTAPRLETARSLILAFFYGRRDMFPCMILFRTEDARRLGGYNPDLKLAFDAFLWLQIAFRRGFALFVDEPLTNYRVHRSSTTQVAGDSIWIEELGVLETLTSRLICGVESNYQRELGGAIRHSRARLRCGRLVQEYRAGGGRWAAMRMLLKQVRASAGNARSIPTFFGCGLRLTLPRSLGRRI